MRAGIPGVQLVERAEVAGLYERHEPLVVGVTILIVPGAAMAALGLIGKAVGSTAHKTAPKRTGSLARGR